MGRCRASGAAVSLEFHSSAIPSLRRGALLGVVQDSKMIGWYRIVRGLTRPKGREQTKGR